MATMDAEIPKSVETVLGPVAVDRVPISELADDKGGNYGDFSWAERRIRVAEELTGWVAVQVYRHEWVHLVLADAGLDGSMSDDVQEIVCDAIANALVQEARASCGVMRSS